MKNLIYIIGIAIILFFIALTIYGYVIAHSYNVITPYNTGNKPVSTIQYCGFGERGNCINIIPQNQPIPVSMIKGVVQ